jgi:uncharacterized CHY-type Zn-finger protein
MSHAIEFMEFSEKTTKEEIGGECYDWYFNNCDLEETGGTNPFDGVSFTNRIFECREDAEDYLERYCGNGECIAVKYKETANFKPSSKLTRLMERQKTLDKRVSELSVSWKADEMKSNTIACKQCGSKLATAYMKGRYNCPLCKNDLRPQTLKDRISKASSDLKEVNSEIAKLEKKETIKHNSKNCSLNYLVLCDVHC